MTPAEFYRDILGPGLVAFDRIQPGTNTPAAARFLLAVAMQESGLTARQQGGGGPASGFWQFEWGGCHGVLTAKASRACAIAACSMATVEPDATAVHAALVGHDPLAVAFARALLFSDPRPVPLTVRDGWACYLRNWRPGKPRPLEWPSLWDTATSTIYPNGVSA